MCKKVETVINIIEGICKETIAFTGACIGSSIFIICLEEILKAYLKQNPIYRTIAYVIGTLSAPIFLKMMKKRLGYSEDECKSIYDTIKVICKQKYSQQ